MWGMEEQHIHSYESTGHRTCQFLQPYMRIYSQAEIISISGTADTGSRKSDFFFFTTPPVEFGKLHNPLKRIKSLLQFIYFWQHRVYNNCANAMVCMEICVFGKLLDTFCNYNLAHLLIINLNILSFIAFVSSKWRILV